MQHDLFFGPAAPVISLRCLALKLCNFHSEYLTALLQRIPDLRNGISNATFQEETQETYIEKYESRATKSYKFYSIICKSVEKIVMVDYFKNYVIKSYAV
jgi:hypothetical protein